ncbi:MAG TPA: MFS transporter [Steroidobacteraceae bacterium]|nr:MFS transporter [Steroidobacteraceae bacterium]
MLAKMPPAAPKGSRTAWLVLAIVAAANFGNFYVYDSIGPVAELLGRLRGFNDTQIGTLNAIYSLPNVVLLLVGGVLVDRAGIGRVMAATAAICFAGAVLTAVGAEFTGMAAGRLLFGIGAETFNVATLAAIVRFAPARHAAFTIGASLALGRAGAFAVDMSPTWMAGAYASGWQPPLLVAAAFAGLSLVMALAYARIERSVTPPGMDARAEPTVALKGLYRFGPAYWQLLALAALWYAVIFAFRSTFSIKYFQHAHGLDLAAAGAINAWVFLAALFATPFFGWVCDRVQRHAPLLAFGALLLPAAIASLALAERSLWVGTVLIGVSFSLVPAVLWPLTARIVPASRYGTAAALVSVALNAGIAGANLVAGQLNDRFGASAANPEGYEPMMAFFFATGVAAFAFSLLMWRSTYKGTLTFSEMSHPSAAPAERAFPKR